MRTLDNIDISVNARLWRYMKVRRFEEFLDQRTLYFAAAFQYEDRFEGAVAVQPHDFPVDSRYVESEPVESAFKELTRLTKLNCWHIADYENDAMWRLYSGLSKGVAITSTPASLGSALTPFRLKPGYGIEELWAGNIKYVDLMVERLRVGMLDRFFYKHRAFEWEREFRLAIPLRCAEEFGVAVPKEGIHVGGDPAEIVESIHLGPALDELERKRITELCAAHGLRDRLIVSSLLGRPRYW